jgi:hypothetical protein
MFADAHGVDLVTHYLGGTDDPPNRNGQASARLVTDPGGWACAAPIARCGRPSCDAIHRVTGLWIASLGQFTITIDGMVASAIAGG